MTKRCFKCLCVKPLAEFYKHAAMGDGHLNKCKDCTKKDVTEHRLANLDRVRAYDKTRASMAHRVAARKEYAQTPAGRQSHKKSLKASALRYPERTSARYALSNAIRDGKVTPWPVCAVPECDHTKPEAHHPDYSKPLDVVWLCPSHHKAAHAVA